MARKTIERVWELECKSCGRKVHCSDEADLEPHEEDHRRNAKRCAEAKFARRQVEALTGKAVK